MQLFDWMPFSLLFARFRVHFSFEHCGAGPVAEAKRRGRREGVEVLQLNRQGGALVLLLQCVGHLLQPLGQVELQSRAPDGAGRGGG